MNSVYYAKLVQTESQAPILGQTKLHPPSLSHPSPYLSLVWPDRATLSHLILLSMNSIIYIILFMNNTFSQKFSKFFSSYIFSHFEIERERERERSRVLEDYSSKNTILTIFSLHKEHSTKQRTHISLLYVKTSFSSSSICTHLFLGKKTQILT